MMWYTSLRSASSWILILVVGTGNMSHVHVANRLVNRLQVVVKLGVNSLVNKVSNHYRIFDATLIEGLHV